MRMRKLGKGQSLIFCSPMEIEEKILKSCGKNPSEKVDVADVLAWSISETWSHTRMCIPLWAIQGLRYQRHFVAWSKLAKSTDTEDFRTIAESFLETEALSVEQRYGIDRPMSGEELLLKEDTEDPSLSGRENQLDMIRHTCREFSLVTFREATLQEMQERELLPENEREQEVENPPPLEPQEHSVDRDVRRFIEKGILDRSSVAFRSAFASLSSTNAFTSFERNGWPGCLLVTTDFARTVQAPKGQVLDSYIRPVQWIASCGEGVQGHYVILSPYEVNELLPSIRRHRAVNLHVYSPRTNVSSRPLEDLHFCGILKGSISPPPPSLVMHLNIFAGQLYWRTYDDHVSLCRFLGICHSPPDRGVDVSSDGFINPEHRAKYDLNMWSECRFSQSPVAFLRALMALRRRGQVTDRSHIGMLLNGITVSERHFRTLKQ